MSSFLKSVGTAFVPTKLAIVLPANAIPLAFPPRPDLPLQTGQERRPAHRKSLALMSEDIVPQLGSSGGLDVGSPQGGLVP